MFVHPDCSFFHTFFVESIFIERTMPRSTWPDLIVPVAGMAATQVPESEGWCGWPYISDSRAGTVLPFADASRYAASRYSPSRYAAPADCASCFQVCDRGETRWPLCHMRSCTSGQQRIEPSDNRFSTPSSHAMRVSLQRQRPCTPLPGSTCRWNPSQTALCDRHPYSAVAGVHRYNVDRRDPCPTSSSTSTGIGGERSSLRQWALWNAAAAVTSTSWRWW